ncbi:M10 family metallopeptidase C-terminal domain-containing protein [Gloeothece verrucosa]|uniref:M10 family metallopeptidase C-terminal domain-containing protein n=1 Tax=Gloeothece verrucosa TaxID=2546359 RepID=UPI00017E2274|nr:M10 family metallopeptidase C-terminal domain-containing protein [Gloeothece verrucosa]
MNNWVYVADYNAGLQIFDVGTKLLLTGTANINGTGNNGNNGLTGNSGNNILSGGNGNDIYFFNASSSLGSDTIIETTTGGIDTLDFTGTTGNVNINLGISSTQTVVSSAELVPHPNQLQLTLSAGNVLENLLGGSSEDCLIGNSLNNTITGGAGNDTLLGGGGNDSLIEGAGNDILTGGTGNDKFIYQTRRAFETGDVGIDVVSDFTSGSDKIVLSKATFTALSSIVGNNISASDFAVVVDDANAASSNALIVYCSSTGSLYYNQNGSASGLGTGAEFIDLPSLAADGKNLTVADFAIIA